MATQIEARKSTPVKKAAKEASPAPKGKPRSAANPGKRVLNILPSKNMDRDWDFANAVDAEVLTASAAIPVSRDMREDWWKINDQGSTGSCVGWATADSVLRQMFVKAGRLGQNDLLSPRFVWMAAKETDEFISQPTTFIEDDGTSLKGVLETYHPETARGGHAVAIVGYTKSAFIIRNSWGTAWGDKGYAYASWSYAQKAFTEAYGVAL